MGLNTVISKAKDENTNKSNIHDGWECMAKDRGNQNPVKLSPQVGA
jgi:hypothetical protein